MSFWDAKKLIHTIKNLGLFIDIYCKTFGTRQDHRDGVLYKIINGPVTSVTVIYEKNALILVVFSTFTCLMVFQSNTLLKLELQNR